MEFESRSRHDAENSLEHPTPNPPEHNGFNPPESNNQNPLESSGFNPPENNGFNPPENNDQSPQADNQAQPLESHLRQSQGESFRAEENGSQPRGEKPQETARSAPKKKKTGLIILLALCGVSIFGGIMNLVSGPPLPSHGPIGNVAALLGDSSPVHFFSVKDTSFGSHKEHIAVIHLEGVIQESNETYNQQWLISTIQSLAHDDRSLGILLYINSPGGGVYESDEVYQELLAYKESSGSPVWAYLGPLAASGGYYIACAADRIIANRNCLTGSIGVIAGQSVDFSEFLENHGIKVNIFVAGSNKAMLGISSPVTEEQAAIMQSLADECYSQFVDIVAESRKLDREKAVALADGRIYTARQALDHGLIDGISRFDAACDSYEETLGMGGIEFLHYYPEEEFDFMSYFLHNIKTFVGGFKSSSPADSLLLEATERIIPKISYPAYYYHQ